MSKQKINFSSENYAGVHPALMDAVVSANAGNVPSYGNDHYTQEAIAEIKKALGDDIAVYFTFNGTGANNLGLACIAEKHHSIFCTDMAHLMVDESTAPEAFIGCRIYTVKATDGKMNIDDLQHRLGRIGDLHHPQPGAVTLTQPTELGTVYTIAELQAIKKICNDNGMLLHVDGARFYNAVEHLGLSLKDMCEKGGIDVLTLGGTKIGMLFGEAVVVFHPKANNAYKYLQKRSMQLASKNRFIAVQFKKLLQDNLWQEIAVYTNDLAKKFEQAVAGVSSVKVAYPVETNAVFLYMSHELHAQLQEHATFYYWDDQKLIARLIFSFNNTEEDIKQFVELLPK